MMLDGIILDRDSRVSLRRQLAGHLESRILGGQIGPGRRLPSLRRAEELLGLHRNTVASAYGDLVRAGLVRTRPGSGVYVRTQPGTGEAGLPRVAVRGRGELDLICADADLGDVLTCELASRLKACVWRSSQDGPEGIALRLSPSVGFFRWVRSLPRPSIVAVISRSERVHRLASIAVLIHGGEGIAYLPVSPAKRRNLERMRRLTGHVAADYAELAIGGPHFRRDVRAMPVVSGLSLTAVRTGMRRVEASNPPRPTHSPTAERSLPASVEEA